MKRKSLVHLAALLVCFFALTQLVFADVTISGTQTRGRGTNGELKCKGESLQKGGVIVRAEDAGAGLWLQSDGGHLLRFNRAADAIGTTLAPGTWYVYPNLNKNNDRAGAYVVVRTGGGSSGSSPSGSGISGTYSIIANNYPGKLELKISGTRGSGRIYYDVAKTWENLKNVSYNPGTGEITFTRPWRGNPTFQQYRGRISGSTISGSFTDNNSPGKSFGWSASK